MFRHRYEVGFWDPANVWRLRWRTWSENAAHATVEAYARAGDLTMRVRPAAHLRTEPEPEPRRLLTLAEFMAGDD